MSIISLSGLIGSGKDTVSDYLVQDYNFRRMSFADTLKDAVAAVFGWDRVMLEGKTPEARAWREQIDTWWAKRLDMPHLTPRWVLQYWGTEVCRKGFHNDMWIASMERQLDACAHTGTNVVISDARFTNELNMLAGKGAKTIVVHRGEKPTWWETAKAAQFDNEALKTMDMLGIHRSEWDWVGYKFDVELHNDRELADLYVSADRALAFNDQ
jgi:hypothetical protein